MTWQRFVAEYGPLALAAIVGLGVAVYLWVVRRSTEDPGDFDSWRSRR